MTTTPLPSLDIKNEARNVQYGCRFPLHKISEALQSLGNLIEIIRRRELQEETSTSIESQLLRDELRTSWCDSLIDIERVLEALLLYVGINVDSKKDENGRHCFHLSILQAFDTIKNPLNSILGFRYAKEPTEDTRSTDSFSGEDFQRPKRESRGGTRDRINDLRKFRNWSKNDRSTDKTRPDSDGFPLYEPPIYVVWYIYVYADLLKAYEICLEIEESKDTQAKEAEAEETASEDISDTVMSSADNDRSTTESIHTASETLSDPDVRSGYDKLAVYEASQTTSEETFETVIPPKHDDSSANKNYRTARYHSIVVASNTHKDKKPEALSYPIREMATKIGHHVISKLIPLALPVCLKPKLEPKLPTQLVSVEKHASTAAVDTTSIPHELRRMRTELEADFAKFGAACERQIADLQATNAALESRLQSALIAKDEAVSKMYISQAEVGELRDEMLLSLAKEDSTRIELQNTVQERDTVAEELREARHNLVKREAAEAQKIDEARKAAKEEALRDLAAYMRGEGFVSILRESLE